MARLVKKIIWFAIIAIVLLSAGVWVRTKIISDADQGSALPPEPDQLPEVSSVSCLGRIAPQDKIIKVGARSLSGQPSIVGRLHVKEGDHVKPGQLLAVLDSREQLEAAWQLAESRITVAERRLSQVKTGAKEADLEAQRAEIARIEAEMATANADLKRAETLQKHDAISLEALDHKRMLVKTESHMLEEAKKRLISLSEVRQVDVDLASAEVEAARAEARRARTEFEHTEIRSPVSGTILAIHAWPGEEIGPQGILELAKTDQMYVIAEVMESDIQRVKVGQEAEITGDALPAPIRGKVEEIRPRVARSSMLNLDPASFSDTRILEVEIRLDESKTAADRIDAQVTVLINP